MSPSLAIHVDTEDNRMVVFPMGEIDYGNVADLRARLLEIAKEPTEVVIIDLRDVTFLDSTALSVLVQAKQRFKEQDTEMSVVNPQRRVARILELAGLVGYLAG